jgi:hypothetical protein
VELKLNGTHHLLAYADDVNLLGDNIGTIRGGEQQQVCIDYTYISIQFHNFLYFLIKYLNFLVYTRKSL